MANISLKLRLYMPHDVDLISLMLTHEIDIVQCLYCAATAFSKGDSFAVKIPPKRTTRLAPRRIYCKNLILDTEKDKNLLELLGKIEDGYRNNFLKNILRLYLFFPVTEEFLINQRDMDIFLELYKSFTDGKRFADAAKDNRKSRNSVYPKNITNVAPVTIKQEKIEIEESIKESLQEKTKDLNDNIQSIFSSSLTAEDNDELTDLFSALLC